MVDDGQWMSFLGVFLMTITLVLSSTGLAAPWWTGEAEKNGYPITTEATLWVSATSWYDVPEDANHYGCSGPCDRTKVGRVRLITACQSWLDFCSEARDVCGGPPTPAPIVGGPPPRPMASPPAPPPPPVPYRRGPTLPPPDLPVQEEKGGTLTTTRTFAPTVTRTTTTTTVTTITTPPLIPMPLTTAPILAPLRCPGFVRQNFIDAEYTPWELAWSMDSSIVQALYAQLNLAMTYIPVVFYAQRPTIVETIRLFWEVLVKRNKHPRWLWQYERDWCPSAPAEALFHWLVQEENKWTYALASEAMRPPNNLVIPDDDFGDERVKEAWEVHVGLRRTTPAPILEEGSQAWHIWDATRKNDDGPAFVAPIDPQDENVVNTGETPTRYRQAPQMTFASCQKAIFESDLAPMPWYERLQPCKLRDSCIKLWAVRGGVVLQLLFALLHTGPSCLSFIGAGTRYGVRFPPTLEVSLAGAGFFVLLIAIVLAITVELPDGSEPPVKLGGLGFGCTVASAVCCLLAIVFGKKASGVVKKTKVQAIQEEEQRKNPVPVKTSLKDLGLEDRSVVTNEMMLSAPDEDMRAVTNASMPRSSMRTSISAPPSPMLALPPPSSPDVLALPPGSPMTAGTMSPMGTQPRIAWGTKAERMMALQA